MSRQHIIDILQNVSRGLTTPEQALLQLRMEPYENLGYARPDHHREIRQGIAEVIYGEGKTADQIKGIVSSMLSKGQSTILITRLSQKTADILNENFNFEYNPLGRVGILGSMPAADGKGEIVVATGGTSDLPVAEEAAFTAQALGNRVVRLYDVGVAGLHRLLHNMESIMNARVIIAIAGMEGALASVIGGLANCPVIGVPTSVGYGANFGGLSALLSMLNSCASGVSVVNIDNGFGAAYLASMINHI